MPTTTIALLGDGTAALLTALQRHDGDTGWHSRRVSLLARRTGALLGLAGAALDDLEEAALVHDAGKLRVPARILRKAGPLSAGEWALVRRHPQWGAELVSEIAGLARHADTVGAHHERWAGGGYPTGRRGHGHSAGGPHHRRVRRLRRDDLEAPARPAAHVRRGARGAACLRRPAVRPGRRGGAGGRAGLPARARGRRRLATIRRPRRLALGRGSASARARARSAHLGGRPVVLERGREHLADLVDEDEVQVGAQVLGDLVDVRLVERGARSPCRCRCAGPPAPSPSARRSAAPGRSASARPSSRRRRAPGGRRAATSARWPS